jgi:hypothetical protein
MNSSLMFSARGAHPVVCRLHERIGREPVRWKLTPTIHSSHDLNRREAKRLRVIHHLQYPQSGPCRSFSPTCSKPRTSNRKTSLINTLPLWQLIWPPLSTVRSIKSMRIGKLDRLSPRPTARKVCICAGPDGCRSTHCEYGPTVT